MTLLEFEKCPDEWLQWVTFLEMADRTNLSKGAIKPNKNPSAQTCAKQLLQKRIGNVVSEYRVLNDAKFMWSEKARTSLPELHASGAKIHLLTHPTFETRPYDRTDATTIALHVFIKNGALQYDVETANYRGGSQGPRRLTE